MRSEQLYLFDIAEAIDALERFCSQVSFDEFLGDELRQSAVLQKFIVIGEAAARLPDDFKRRHPDIEWEDVIGFRNIAVHEYFAILWEIVWDSAIQDIPVLRSKINQIIGDEF
jgi:uncharacterized protein with HEPN domain